MFRGNVVTDTAELALDGDTLVVIRGGGKGVEWCSALWVRIVMVVMPISKAVVMPAGSRVDQSGWVELLDTCRQMVFRVIRVPELAPSFIVDDLR